MASVHCLCSLASWVRDAVLVLMLTQMVLCTILFNGMVPILPAMVMDYIPWDMVGFMYITTALPCSLRWA